jgi:hypothetical protein
MLSVSDKLGMPTWAALTADNLSRFAIPNSIRRLIIAVDNDAAGVAAANTLLARAPPGMRAETASVPEGFNDFNDWVRG